MQENMLYNARNTDGVLKGLKLQRGTRRQNSSSCVGGIDSKNTVNKLTANSGQEQFYLLAPKMILMQS